MTERTHRLSCLQRAEQAFRRHLAEHPMRHYASILTLHGAVRLAQISGSAPLRATVLDPLDPFWDGQVEKISSAPSSWRSARRS